VATGDDWDGNDDEDGMQIPILVQGVPTPITMQVSGGGGLVDAWIDFNGDRDWTTRASRSSVESCMRTEST